MDSDAKRRRRERRRVPDEKRKRASRACALCKARKSKCIETGRGACQRCQEQSLRCDFDHAVSSPIRATADLLLPENIEHAAPTTSVPGQVSSAEASVWPGFLARLRETFALDTDHDPLVRSQHTTPLRNTNQALQPGQLKRAQKAAGQFPPRGIARFLLAVCNEHGTDASFYYNQSRLSEEIDCFYNDSSSELRHDSAFLCLAHAVFALGSQWATLARSNGDPSSNAGVDPGMIFHQSASELMPDILELSSFRAVQALFVIGVYLLPASAISSSYVYLGLALRKALVLNLHQEIDDSLTATSEREQRRRLWWSIYCLERNTSIKLKRPRSIESSVITAKMPSPCRTLDVEQVFHNVPHQIANAALTLILDKIDENKYVHHYSQGAVFDRDRLSHDVECPMAQALKDWKKSLPAELKFRNNHPKSSDYRATFHLHLNYHFAWITMGKLSLATIVKAHLQSKLGRIKTPPQVSERELELSQSCIRSAKKVLRMFEDVQSTGNLARFSFTDFQGCSIATIVLSLASIMDQDTQYSHYKTLGQGVLRNMANGSATATAGLEFVEAFIDIANEAIEKLKDASNTQAISDSSNFTAWESWLFHRAAGSGAMTQHQVAEEPYELTIMDPLSVRPDSSTGTDHVPVIVSEDPILQEIDNQNTFVQIPDLENFSFAQEHPEEPMFLMGLTGLDMLDFGL